MSTRGGCAEAELRLDGGAWLQPTSPGQGAPITARESWQENWLSDSNFVPLRHPEHGSQQGAVCATEAMCQCARVPVYPAAELMRSRLRPVWAEHCTTAAALTTPPPSLVTWPMETQNLQCQLSLTEFRCPFSIVSKMLFKCESASRRLQPGAGPSSGLLCI